MFIILIRVVEGENDVKMQSCTKQQKDNIDPGKTENRKSKEDSQKIDILSGRVFWC
jgi:hypothetical protein